MPYKAVKNGENWDVVNSETGEVKATHEPPDAQIKAEKQVQLLETVEERFAAEKDTHDGPGGNHG